MQYLYLFASVVLMALAPTSLDRDLAGCVTDESGDPLIGASILVKGTAIGVVTDLDGCFKLTDLPEGKITLLVSYTGYNLKEVMVEEEDRILEIKLNEEAMMLEEVTVTSMGIKAKKKKRKKAKERTADLPADMEMELKGKVAGVTISEERAEGLVIRGSRDDATHYYVDGKRVTGAPEIKIRGVSSLSEDETSASKLDFMSADVSELPQEAAGQLTAGEVNDFSKWDMWADIAEEDLGMYRQHWGIHPRERYVLQLTTEDGAAIVDAKVVLRSGENVGLWEAKTDNTGKAELWRAMFEPDLGEDKGLNIRVQYQREWYELDQVKPFQQGVNFLKIPVACNELNLVDVAFVVDATGSMSDEISYLQAELTDVIKRVQDSLPNSDLQSASVFYRDIDDDYLTRVQDFSIGSKETVAFMQEQRADGGGDTPEAVESALQDALNKLSWRKEAAARLLFLVLDAPPHNFPQTIETMHHLTKQAAAMGVRIIPVTGSGVDKSTEYLMRSLALATNGTYTFLTNHSGIGGDHIEPSTDSYDVEKLNDLLVRLSIQFGTVQACAPVYADQVPNDDPIVSEPSDQNANPVTWKFFPNPSAGPINLSFSDKGKGQLYLTDINGKILERFSQPGETQKLDFGAYPSGQYVLVYEDINGDLSNGRLVLLP